MNSDFVFQRLNDPEPKEVPCIPKPRMLPNGKKDYLPIPEERTSLGVFDVMLQRRTRRNFSYLTKEDLSALLWHSSKVIEIQIREDGSHWQHRPVPSAGGCHPIDILILQPSGSTGTCLKMYDPIAHALIELPEVSQAEISNFKMKIGQLVSLQDGTVFVFAAQFSRTMSRYRNGESLVWRDAGMLAMGLTIVAEALDLNLCILGLTAEQFVRKIFADEGYGGVGACVVGSK